MRCLVEINRRVPVRRLILPRLQRLHFLPSQLKVKDIRILLDARRRHRFRERNEALHLLVLINKDNETRGTDSLQSPSNHHLRRTLPMLLPDIPQHPLSHPRPMRKRRIRLHYDIPLLKPVCNLRPIQPRVQLVLSD